MLTKVNDIEMYYELHGKGEPLILIGGYGTSSESWSPFWKQLLKLYQVILFDNRGTGRSSKPDIKYSIKMMADDVAGLMDAINVPKAHIFGASMGGMIAQELVLNHPEKVESLILGMTSCGGPQSIKFEKEIGMKMLTTANPPSDMPMEEVMELMLSVFYSPNYIEENRDLLIKEAMSIKYPTPNSSRWRHVQAVISWKGSYDRLSDIRVPTLIMGGENDVIFPQENFRILAEQIPGSKLQVLKDAAHAFTREKEDQAVAAIIDFLERSTY